jgi:hypothetical protein
MVFSVYKNTQTFGRSPQSFSPIGRVIDKRVTTTIGIVLVWIQQPLRVDFFTNFQD